MSQVRREERFAFAVAERVLAATVEPYDICGRQGAVDALVHYPKGPTAALEVSSIGPDDEAGIIQYLGSRGDCKTIPGLMSKWLVEVPRNFHPADMRKVEMALHRCEEQAAVHLHQSAGTDRNVDALLAQGVRADVLASPAGEADPVPSRVYFLLPVMAGFTSRGMASLPDELAEILRSTKMRSKMSKLAATGLQERHLILIVRPSAFSFPVYDGLAFGGPLPTGAPCLPDGLSQIWLLTGIRAGGVVRGISGRGWYRDQPYEDSFEVAI